MVIFPSSFRRLSAIFPLSWRISGILYSLILRAAPDAAQMLR